MKEGEGGMSDYRLEAGQGKYRKETLDPPVRSLMMSRDEIASLMMSRVYWSISCDMAELGEGSVPSKTVQECEGAQSV